MSGTGHGQAVTRVHRQLRQHLRPSPRRLSREQPDHRLHPQERGLRRHHPWPADRRRRELSLYCIDINTTTYGGIGYVLGTWDTANVPNVDYVARLLNEYYPNTNEPAALTDLNQKAAAVQAAIWFFTDKYVLNTSDPLHGTVAAIVDHIKTRGRWASSHRPASPSPRRS